MSRKIIQMSQREFNAVKDILENEWFACDYPERLKYYEGEGAEWEPGRAEELQKASEIASEWLARHGVQVEANYVVGRPTRSSWEASREHCKN